MNWPAAQRRPDPAQPTTTDAQRAFVDLLVRPLVTPASDPRLHREVTRNSKQVGEYARRLGYRLTAVGRAVRLVRVPLAGTVTAPPAPHDQPGRRVLALACILAAACEETSGGATLAKLSALVMQVSAASVQVLAYDQAQVAHRRQLLRAASLLEHWGVLRRRTPEDHLLEAWADAGAGIGAGYDIDRDALLLLTSPEVLDLAAAGHAPDPEMLAASRSMRALRALVETPAVLYSDLAPDEADALRATRGLRADAAIAVTGGHVEARAEGMVLILPDEPVSEATVNWPRAAAAEWVALLMADLAGHAGTRDGSGVVALTEAQVDDVALDLHTWRGTYMNKAMREDVTRVRYEAERWLRHLGLLRTPADGSWLLSPVAGRYRDPEVIRHQPSAASILGAPTNLHAPTIADQEITP